MLLDHREWAPFACTDTISFQIREMSPWCRVLETVATGKEGHALRDILGNLMGDVGCSDVRASSKSVNEERDELAREEQRGQRKEITVWGYVRLEGDNGGKEIFGSRCACYRKLSPTTHSSLLASLLSGFACPASWGGILAPLALVAA